MASEKNNMKLAILLIIVAATMSSLSQLVWKFGADTKSSGLAWGLYILGFVLAGLGMVIMSVAFRYGEVSILHPMMSLGFALSIVFGALFLQESITIGKVIGTILIIAGSALLGYEGGRNNG
ncbi:MAG: EamA family transporter [Lactobacillus sp.]|jgi:undecaprenyl phosphate-alpha-L-ara4N flippase subunit ArnE|nr:EamA family transporter [Lactobacillus sp.]MCH3989737.1 EamA family transporter [Lactobacillus sp.]MCH4068097.1 EamA family transporter [Lactobacillus sp.]MCI1304278.1 EamA family transporter [Lactobacillus sp.]MCI1330027.1 EamA family transporter [Lactobacillus sp.]